MELDKIYCGDCLEIMRTFPDESVDITITSIPFNAKKDYGKTYSDDLPEEKYLKNLDLWFFQMVRVSKIALYIFTSTRHMEQVRQRLPGFVQWLFWHRPNIVSPSLKLPWIPTITPIAMAWKNGRRPMKNGEISCRTFDLIVATSPQSSFGGELHRRHVAQDPVDVIRPLIARTEGKIILDPFLGTGTTLIAAKELGRHFIGIEINPDYCRIAENRLAQTGYQKEMFP